MSKRWQTPYYDLKTTKGKPIKIDVTGSISPGLPPNKTIVQRLVPLLTKEGITTVVDFGAGALRHTLPLLEAGIEVCAVEFKEAFLRPSASEAQQVVEKNSLFHKLYWPDDFLRDDRKYGAALLLYVLQVIPLPAERQLVLKTLSKRVESEGLLLYASRFGQVSPEDSSHKVSDGYFRGEGREKQTFYREFGTPDTHDMMKKYGFHRLQSWSERGTEQWFLYGKGKVVFA